MIEICTVGGYNEVGKNMTAIKVDDEVVIIDMGLHMESYINYTEVDEHVENISAHELLKVGAIPDDSVIKKWKSKVKAIIPTHAHLDHVGALVFMANNYKAPIICTPFTAEVVKAISKDQKRKLKNEIKTLNVNSMLKLSPNLKVEFINMTHSTPQTVMVALHTKYGIVLYSNDFKFDNHPVIGKKPNYKRLKELSKKGVLCNIVDCTRAENPVKTPSENVAREMLRDVMLGTDSKGKAVIVTTFASHLARLKSIIEFGKKMNRKIVFLGRSLSKYTMAAENIKLVNFSKQVEIVRFGKKIKKKLRQIEKAGREKYLLIVTGHQGEPKATLSKIARKELQFKLKPEDHIIFSCGIIPSPTNIKNRKNLEGKLKLFGVRIFRDIHVSGHAAKEDLRDLITLVDPKHIIPAHGDDKMKNAFVELAKDKGYKVGKNIHTLRDGSKIRLR